MSVHVTCFSFLLHCVSQELVSVGTEGRMGYLSVLGNVKHKIVCSPDFEALLERSAWFLLEGWKGLSLCLSTVWVLILCCYYGGTSFARSMAFDCVVFRVAIKTIHPLNNMNLFSYCSWDILKFECCAKSKYCLKSYRRLYMDVNVWIIKLLSKYVGVRKIT